MSNPYAHISAEHLLSTIEAVRIHASMQERLFGAASQYLKDSLDALEKALADKTAKAE